MIFADNCSVCFFQGLEDPTEELRKRGLDWKEDQMETIAWGLEGEVGDLQIQSGGQVH